MPVVAREPYARVVQAAGGPADVVDLLWVVTKKFNYLHMYTIL
jgi:hypothetical protein